MCNAEDLDLSCPPLDTPLPFTLLSFIHWLLLINHNEVTYYSPPVYPLHPSLLLSEVVQIKKSIQAAIIGGQHKSDGGAFLCLAADTFKC